MIWSCGFSKRQAFIQAVDGRGRFTARFKPAAATVCVVYYCAFCKRESARECRRACVCSEDVSIVQMHVESSACGGVCVFNFAFKRTRNHVLKLFAPFQTIF